MSAVLPQPGGRTSAVAALLVVGGGLVLAYVLIKGMFSIASALSLMQGPMPESHVREAPAPPRSTK
jgi:hypothetical protein